MKGRVVLVTGANGGLGTYVTRAFLDAGAIVVGTSRKIQQSDFLNPNFTALPAEISTRDGAQTLVDQVVARFGKLDALAHTVGGFAGGQSIADTDDATFQRMFDLNLNCVFHILRAAVPPLRKTGTGRIIAIGSRAALEPGAGVGVYSASKAAMVSLIRTVAIENKDAGLTANAHHPPTWEESRLAGSGFEENLDNPVSHFKLLRGALGEQRINALANVSGIFFPFQEQKTAWGQSKTFRHGDDRVQAWHFVATFHVPPEVSSDIASLRSVFEAEFRRLSKFSDPLCE
jgi:NAD(P)-dependent dehydrogenase (short-subunit alcohol dehydrogenase family)